MNDLSSFRPERFSWKRVLLLVAAVQLVLAATLIVYWRVYRHEFFPYPINSDGTVTVQGGDRPVVVGYGAQLAPPWTFSGVESDTLRLNGLPFDPMRSDGPMADAPTPMRDRLRTVQAVLEEAESAYKGAESKVEGMHRFRSVLEGYQGILVTSVDLDVPGERIDCKFGDDLPAITVNFIHDPHWVEPLSMLRKRHYDTMRIFIDWMKTAPDGVFGFGEHYVVVSEKPEDRVENQRVLRTLGDVSARTRRVPTVDDMRHALADDDLSDRYKGLILDYLNFRAEAASER